MFLCYIKKSCITADYSNLEFGLFPSKIKPNPLSKQNSKITILICFFLAIDVGLEEAEALMETDL